MSEQRSQSNSAPELAQTTGLDSSRVLTTTDPRLAIQFRTRSEAVSGAKAIHWPVKSPMRMEVMGFLLWTLADDHCRFLTRTGYASLLAEIRA